MVDGLSYLSERLAVVESRVQAAVARRRATDPTPDDHFRGLYITDADVDRLLAGPGPGPGAGAAADPAEEPIGPVPALEAAADRAEAAGTAIPLRRLARAFDLAGPDVDLLLVAMAPDLDPRFERLYGYLHDDVTRRRASTGLALELCGGGRVTGPARARLGPSCPLVEGGLLVVEDADRPFLTRSLRVPDRVTGHLLGDRAHDPAVERLLSEPVEADIGDPAVLARAVGQGVTLVYLRERLGATGLSYAATALRRAGRPVVALDLGRLGPDDDLKAVAATAGREARLRGGALVAGPIEVLADRGPGAVRPLAETPGLVVLIGGRGWDARWSSRRVPLLLDAPVPTTAQRGALWRGALDGDAPPGLDPAAATVQFRLTPEQVASAAAAARQQARADARLLEVADLHAGARSQNAAGLERLARRVEPQVDWNELVLPAGVLGQLQELTARARHRDKVLDDWGMARGSSKGRGIAALFAGESGTGKTISAEAVAADLGLHLYVIDLATVVDKYIGETEKNLDRIFDEADRVNGVLLFDEADAIFGKRSEVKDAHDRYANVEVAYLLQRIERFDGVAVLTTNLRANVDEAFTRRLDAVVDFQVPDEADRRLLWRRHLRAGVPREDDIDLDFLARAFKLSGGNIRNIALGAAFLAAGADRPVAMADLVRATEREYRKLGRLCLEAEFGPYFRMIVGV
ncbi:MAG: hypothetical protein QOG82_642 [Actinomycetota bacterium]|jgi:hypothetical protein|nr:hypothetical protein [Actinomycetota bacterium]